MATNSWQIELATIPLVSAHYVGNRNNGHELILSEKPLDTDDHRMNELLFTYFLGAFREPEMNHFTFSNDDFKLNPLYQFACSVFDNKVDFHLNSVNIARHLFDVSNHPQIKSGDLFVAYIDGVIFNNKECKAIGIFKSENKQSFLKLYQEANKFDLYYDAGINVDKLDKGCLIVDANREEGFQVCIVDRGNKGTEAQFWKDQFLQITPWADEYHHTKEFLSLTKTYVTTQFKEDFNINKTEEIDVLNRSMEYFKTHETFDKEEFVTEVFHEPEMIKSFHNFDTQYQETHNLEIEQSFEISPSAVKKQQKVFKSILKLDKNFTIYIHGNREQIQPGTDPDGKRFYKIYYNEEN